MEEKMEEWSSRFDSEGDFVRGKQFSQLYRCVIDLLEQIHDLLGDEKISGKDYLELLETGFEEIRLGTLPQETDRLLVGDIERTRVSQCRVLFFTGVNDGNIPRGTSRGGLLSDLDKTEPSAEILSRVCSFARHNKNTEALAVLMNAMGKGAAPRRSKTFDF